MNYRFTDRFLPGWPVFDVEVYGLEKGFKNCSEYSVCGLFGDWAFFNQQPGW